ncbi:MAG: hypothetical protein O3A63_18085 [Proteobacteria bacterium]|nr:hypothetical protein [Pseudomonadota bacterium]
MTGRFRACLVTLLVSGAYQVQALEGAIGLSAYADYTSNTLRVSSPKVEEWIYRPGVDFTASHDGPTFQVDAGYRYERRIYEKDLNDDRNVTTGSANIDWQAIANRLDFYVRNTRNESTINSQQADRPNNRQVTSITEAGPLLRFQTRGAAAMSST